MTNRTICEQARQGYEALTVALRSENTIYLRFFSTVLTSSLTLIRSPPGVWKSVLMSLLLPPPTLSISLSLLTSVPSYSQRIWGAPENIWCFFFLRPRKHVCCVRKSTDILFLSEVIVTSGFATPSTLSGVDMCHYVVVCFIVEYACTLKIAQWVLEIIFHQPYSRKICSFHFGDRHLGFLADVNVMRYRKWHH